MATEPARPFRPERLLRVCGGGEQDCTFGRKLYLFGNRYTEPKDQLVVFIHLFIWVHLKLEF